MSPTNVTLKAAILVISDTASLHPETDEVLPVLEKQLSEAMVTWKVVNSHIIPDDVAAIQTTLRDLIDKRSDNDNINLILTSGGTGFSTKDHTPEIVASLIERPAPGIVHAMISASLQITPFAMMSRPVAGIRKKTVIVTLPGSPKGASENLVAILPTLPHACLQANDVSSRNLHAGGTTRLEEEAGIKSTSPDAKYSGFISHSCGYHHGVRHAHRHGNFNQRIPSGPISNDPSAGASGRNRASPYPLLSVEAALSLIFKNVPVPVTTRLPVNIDIVGHILAESVKSPTNVPAFRASTVDGYAVVLPESGALNSVFPVVSISHATPGEEQAELKEGQIARITTGAPLPLGANTVVMVEDTRLHKKTNDGLEEAEVEIAVDEITIGENIREIGSDVAEGSVILSAGERVSGVGGELGLLASVGVHHIKVYRKPVVGVLSTGDEIVEHDHEAPLRRGEVRDTNRLSLMSAIRQWGFKVLDLGIVKDKSGTLEGILRGAMRTVDVIITSGGVSMGELDLLKPTIERTLGGTIHFGRVSMKPGKPTTFATIPFKQNDGDRTVCPIFSLPGNPASALVTFHLFVLPALQKMAGQDKVGLPKVFVIVEENIPLDPARPEFHRAVVSIGQDGLLHAVSTGGQRSSKVGSLRMANALLCMPAGQAPVLAGFRVEALLLGEIHGF